MTATKKTPAAKAKTLHTEIGTGRQSVCYTELIELAGRKLKVFIESDSYDFQSCARISALQPDAVKWEVIGSIHYSKMWTQHKLKYMPIGANSPLSFAKDRDALVQIATLLLA
jgi:hypothetical protein